MREQQIAELEEEIDRLAPTLKQARVFCGCDCAFSIAPARLEEAVGPGYRAVRLYWRYTYAGWFTFDPAREDRQARLIV